MARTLRNASRRSQCCSRISSERSSSDAGGPALVAPQATLSLKGIGASPGIAVGPAYLVDRRKVRTPKLRLPQGEVDTELMRLKTAIELSDHQLLEIKDRLSQGEGHDHALILEAHRLMVHDPMFIDEVKRLISRDRINAEWAVRRVARKIKHMFDNIPDDYFRERRADLDFVADRVVRNLMGQAVDVEVEIPDGCVLVAHDLSPADTAMMAKSGRVAGFVTDLGGHTSHTAIVARAREIPAVVGAARASDQISPGEEVAIDGNNGLILVNPTVEQLALFQETRRRYQASEQIALKMKDLPAISTDGYRIQLFGNIEFVEEIASLLSHGISLSRARPSTRRRGAVPVLSTGPRGDARASSHHPHARSRRGQSAGRPQPRARAEPDHGPAGNPLLSGQPRALSGPASSPPSGQPVRKLEADVSSHLGRVGASRGAQRVGALPKRARARGSAGRGPLPGRDHGRDTLCRLDRRPVGARGRLLLHWYQ